MAERDINLELTAIAEKIKDYSRPEELFGSLEGDDPLKLGSATFRQLSRILHPDRYPNPAENAVAEESFKRLSSLWSMAQTKIKNGTYGTIEAAFDPVIIKTARHDYQVRQLTSSGEITNTYLCSYDKQPPEMETFLKVARDPADNDLVSNEAEILRTLAKSEGYDKFKFYYPALIDSLRYRDSGESTPRQANILSVAAGLYSLEEVRKHYPAGIHPKDMAWMWRRLLVAEGFIHINDIVNGAILPANLLVQPEKHGVVINDWSYALEDPDSTGESIKAISSDYESWYPAEVLRKQPPGPVVDIAMGARCMIYIMGGDPLRGSFPSTVEPPLQDFFHRCLHPSRTPEAWELMESFDELIGSLWGPRKFRPFSMPAKNIPKGGDKNGRWRMDY